MKRSSLTRTTPLRRSVGLRGHRKRPDQGKVRDTLRSQPKPLTGARKGCLYCGVEFEGDWKRKYCSLKCANLATAERRRTGVDRICEECGKTFYVKASRLGERRFCSRSCWSARDRRSPESLARMSRVQMETRRGLGNPGFTHGKSEKNRPNRKYFSLALKGEAACRNCGQPATHLHHIVPRSKAPGGRNDLTNGLPLCKDCHMGWHYRTATLFGTLLTQEELACAIRLAGPVWVERNYPMPLTEDLHRVLATCTCATCVEIKRQQAAAVLHGGSLRGALEAFGGIRDAAV